LTFTGGKTQGHIHTHIVYISFLTIYLQQAKGVAQCTSPSKR